MIEQNDKRQGNRNCYYRVSDENRPPLKVIEIEWSSSLSL